MPVYPLAKETTTDGQPLAATAEHDHVSSANVLLQCGADIKTRDKNGWTLLLRAVNSNSHSVLKLLLRKKGSHHAVSFRGETILHFVVGKGDHDTLEVHSSVARKDLDIDLKNEKDQRAEDLMKSRNFQFPQLVAAFNSLIRGLRYET
jgi:ankyrin repeat protein